MFSEVSKIDYVLYIIVNYCKLYTVYLWLYIYICYIMCHLYFNTHTHAHTYIYIYNYIIIYISKRGPYPFADHFRGEGIIMGITIKILGRSLFKTWGIKLFTIKVVSTIKLRTCQILVIWNIRILHCRNVTIQYNSNIFKLDDFASSWFRPVCH